MFPNPRHEPFFVPPGEIARRLKALQAAMAANDVALAWIEHTADRLYFSGSAQDGVLLVPAAGDAVFHVRKSLCRAQSEASVEARAYPGGKALLDEVARSAGPNGRIGLALDVTPAASYVRLLDGREAARLIDLGGTIRTIRSVKSPWELEQIRRAADQVTTLLGEIPEQIRPGMGELELTGLVEGRLRELGHGGTIRVRRSGAAISMGVVVSGESALYPTSFPGPVGAEGPYPTTASGAGWKQLATGETVMLDLVTSHNGYHADTTRAYYLGDTVPDAALAAHEFCRDVLRRIEQRLRPGNVCSAIYREIAGWAEQRGEPQGFMGFAENRVRFFGHGVGLELDEMPVLAARLDVTLEPGMVLAVEPKAFLEGIGPVGVENTYVVGDTGCTSLCDVDDALLALPA